jgi:hypothetical protein
MPLKTCGWWFWGIFIEELWQREGNDSNNNKFTCHLFVYLTQIVWQQDLRDLVK